MAVIIDNTYFKRTPATAEPADWLSHIQAAVDAIYANETTRQAAQLAALKDVPGTDSVPNVIITTFSGALEGMTANTITRVGMTDEAYGQ